MFEPAENYKKDFKELEDKIYILKEEQGNLILADIISYLTELNESEDMIEEKKKAMELLCEEYIPGYDQDFGFWTLNGSYYFTFNREIIQENSLNKSMKEFINTLYYMSDSIGFSLNPYSYEEDENR